MDSDTSVKPWILKSFGGKVPVAFGWTSSASVPADSNATSSPGSQADSSAPHTSVIATVAFRAGVPSPLICHVVTHLERKNGVQTALANTWEAFRNSLRSSADMLLEQQEDDDTGTGGEEDGEGNDNGSILPEELHWQRCDERVRPRVTPELYEQMINTASSPSQGTQIRFVSEDEYKKTVSDAAHHFSVASSRPDQSECGVGVGPDTEPDPWALGTVPTPPEPQPTDTALSSSRSMGSIWKRLRAGSSSPTPGQL